MKNNVIGNNIKELRENTGYNQKNLADFLEVDQSLISKIESGERSISADMLEKLATLFGLTSENLTKENAIAKTLTCAFRGSDLTSNEMNVISAVNRIALNSEFMQKILEEKGHD